MTEVTDARALSPEQRVVLGLWSIPGLGAHTLHLMRQRLGPLVEYLEKPPQRWVDFADVPAKVRQSLLSVKSVAHIADATVRRALQGGMNIAFRGEAAYPRRLASLDYLDAEMTLEAKVKSAPPLLFYRGEPEVPTRALAMVGSRHPDGAFIPWAEDLARNVAASGVNVVSGAAIGIDQACHSGALACIGKTWAFLGSGLSRLDPAQEAFERKMLHGGGVYFSEYPPNVHADKGTFPRRNRLIAGVADAVLVLRAGIESGAMHTARFAVMHQRPLLAVPGDPMRRDAKGCNALIKAGAGVVTEVNHVFEVLKVQQVPRNQGTPQRIHATDLSEDATKVLAVLSARDSLDIEGLASVIGLSSSALTSAVCELELKGLVQMVRGKRYERV